MGNVYDAIASRMAGYGINLKDFIYVDPTEGETLLEEDTTLDGISFVPRNKWNLSTDQSIIGSHDFIAAITAAKSDEGMRAFAGQILDEDLQNLLLQGSFGATEGTGFREIFYLPAESHPAIDPSGRVLTNREDHRFFDLQFGKFVGQRDRTALHITIDDRSAPPFVKKPSPGNSDQITTLAMRNLSPGGENRLRSSIHLDDKGFIFSGRDGVIRTSVDFAQHTFDELILKDKLFGAKSPLTGFVHVSMGSIADRNMVENLSRKHNTFLRNQPLRAIAGLELSTQSNGWQPFLRGSLGVNVPLNDDERRLEKYFSLAAGLRKDF